MPGPTRRSGSACRWSTSSLIAELTCAAACVPARRPSRSRRPPRSPRTAARESRSRVAWYAASATASGTPPASASTICVGQQLGVAQRVGDAVRGDRVLEVAGVADQRPARAPGPAGRSRARRAQPRIGLRPASPPRTRSASPAAAGREQRRERLLDARPVAASRIRAGVVLTKTQVGSVVGRDQPGRRARRRRPTRSRSAARPVK